MKEDSMNYDFSGWATRNDLKCSDGRVIRSGAFKDCDGKQVPLVWQHQHNGVENVLGHAILENRPEGFTPMQCSTTLSLVRWQKKLSRTATLSNYQFMRTS